MISSGSNGYGANPGYNLVTGLGTPAASTLVPDLVAYSGPGTTYSGPTVGPLQDATLNTSGLDGAGEIDVFSVFDALPVSAGGVGTPKHGTPAAGMAAATDRHERADVRTSAPDTADPAAPASAIAAAGMMPLADVIAAHDAALTGWASPGSGTPGRLTDRPKDSAIPTVGARSGPVPVRRGRSRSRGRSSTRRWRVSARFRRCWTPARRACGAGIPGAVGPPREPTSHGDGRRPKWVTLSA